MSADIMPSPIDPKSRLSPKVDSKRYAIRTGGSQFLRCQPVRSLPAMADTKHKTIAARPNRKMPTHSCVPIDLPSARFRAFGSELPTECLVEQREGHEVQNSRPADHDNETERPTRSRTGT